MAKFLRKEQVCYVTKNRKRVGVAGINILMVRSKLQCILPPKRINYPLKDFILLNFII